MIGVKGIIGIIAVICLMLFVFVDPLNLGLLGASDYNTGFPPDKINYQKTYPGSWTYDPITGSVSKSMGVAGCEIWGICSGDRWYGNIEEGYTELHGDSSNQPIATAYIKDEDILSETIYLEGVVSSRVGIDGARSSAYAWRPNLGWYRVRINEGTGWTTIIDASTIDERYVEHKSGTNAKQSYSWASWFQTESVQDIKHLAFKLKGQHVGVLEVKQRTEFTNVLGMKETHTTSTDFIYLVSGEGEIRVQGIEPTFEVGEKVPIWVSCDYSGDTVSGTGRWELRWFGSCGQTGLIDTFDDWTRQTIHWEIPASAWQTGCDPIIILELRNTLFKEDAVWTDVIDLKAHAPPTPTIEVDSNHIDWYEPIVVSGSCTPNLLTGKDISYFRIRARWTDQIDHLGEWKVYPTNQNPSTFSLTIPGTLTTRTGTIMITVKAADINDPVRYSLEPAIEQVTVHLPGEEPVEWIGLVVAAIILIIFGLIAVFAPQPFGLTGKIVIGVVGIAIAVLVYFYADFTILTDWWESIWWLP